MVKTHETLCQMSTREDALDYIKSNFETKGDLVDKFAVPADGLKHSSPALSYRVEGNEIRYVHALRTGHVVVRYDRDSERGYGPHSDQKSRRNGSTGHPR